MEGKTMKLDWTIIGSIVVAVLVLSLIAALLKRK